MPDFPKETVSSGSRILASIQQGHICIRWMVLTFKYNMRRTEYIICIQLICLNKTEQHMNLIQKINTMGAGRKFCLQPEERSIKKELSVTDVKNKHMDTKWERGRMNWKIGIDIYMLLILCINSCQVLWDTINYSPLESSVYGILQARILEGVAISFSRQASWPRDPTQVFCTAGRFFTVWAARETPIKQITQQNLLYSTGNLVLCGDLKGKAIQKGWDIFIYMADSLCDTAETNTAV